MTHGGGAVQGEPLGPSPRICRVVQGGQHQPRVQADSGQGDGDQRAQTLPGPEIPAEPEDALLALDSGLKGNQRTPEYPYRETKDLLLELDCICRVVEGGTARPIPADMPGCAGG